MRKILLLICLISALPLTALARLYQLELLVYKQPSIGRDQELWQTHPAEPQNKTRFPLATSNTPRDLFYHKKLLEAKTQVIFQKAWLFSDARVVKLELEETGERLWGYMTIRPGRYIEIRTDLLYEVAASSLPSSISRQFSEDIAKFPLVDKRRLVPGVTYYYDHPLIGMIAKVNPA